jgi:hypothetical protein
VLSCCFGDYCSPLYTTAAADAAAVAHLKKLGLHYPPGGFAPGFCGSDPVVGDSLSALIGDHAFVVQPGHDPMPAAQKFLAVAQLLLE